MESPPTNQNLNIFYFKKIKLKFSYIKSIQIVCTNKYFNYDNSVYFDKYVRKNILNFLLFLLV